MQYVITFPVHTGNDIITTIGINVNHMILSCHCRVTVTLRDYNKMRQQDCSVVTYYGGNKFGCLTDVAIGINDEVVIVDNTNKCVIVLDCNMTLLSVIGQGSGDSRLVNPIGVAVSKDGIIAVSDWGSHQVKKYSLQGKLLSVIGNKSGNNNGQFDAPRGLVFGSNKMLYIVDRGNHRIQVFEDDKFAFTFGSEGSNPGQFQYPIRIAIDTENKVLVSDYDVGHISLFSHTGSFISRVTCGRPWSITVSPDGYIITDCDDKITIWSPAHQLVHQFGKKGSQQGEFDDIRGIAMNSAGTIYVAEYDNKRLQIINQ